MPTNRPKRGIVTRSSNTSSSTTLDVKVNVINISAKTRGRKRNPSPVPIKPEVQLRSSSRTRHKEIPKNEIIDNEKLKHQKSINIININSSSSTNEKISDKRKRGRPNKSNRTKDDDEDKDKDISSDGEKQEKYNRKAPRREEDKKDNVHNEKITQPKNETVSTNRTQDKQGPVTINTSPIKTRSNPISSPLRLETRKHSPSNTESFEGRVIRMNPNLTKIKIENDYNPKLREESEGSDSECQIPTIDIEPYNPYAAFFTASTSSTIKVESETVVDTDSKRTDQKLKSPKRSDKYLNRDYNKTNTFPPQKSPILTHSVPDETFEKETSLGGTDNQVTSEFIKYSLELKNMFPTPPPTENSSSGDESPEHPSSSSSSTTSVSSNTDDNSNVVTVLTEIPPSKKLRSICGAATVHGNLTLLVEWEPPESDDGSEEDEEEEESPVDVNFVDSKELNIKYPQEVIRFYEKHLSFLVPMTKNSDLEN